MTNDSPTRRPRLRLALTLWVAGMLGVVVITLTVLPQLLSQVPLPAPLPLLQAASLAQSGVLLALAVWSGVALAHQVALRAPGFEAAARGEPIRPALAPQLVPGMVAGIMGGAALFGIGGYAAPAALAEVQQQFALPILARLLYGGITEELLLRWGLMTALLWLAWRMMQRRSGAPRNVLVWSAITVSALLFAIGHLPAAYMLVGRLTVDVVLFVLAVNTAFGMLFGYLFWRHGLEAAMLAHAIAHLVAYTAGLV